MSAEYSKIFIKKNLKYRMNIEEQITWQHQKNQSKSGFFCLLSFSLRNLKLKATSLFLFLQKAFFPLSWRCFSKTVLLYVHMFRRNVIGLRFFYLVTMILNFRSWQILTYFIFVMAARNLFSCFLAIVTYSWYPSGKLKTHGIWPTLIDAFKCDLFP